MRIWVTGQQGESEFLENVEGPWKLFKDQISSAGNNIVSGDINEPFDTLIANYHSEKILNLANFFSVPKFRRVLIIWEPSIVDNQRYIKKNLNQYGHIYAPSIDWANKVNGKKFNWPQDILIKNDSKIWQDWKLRKKKIIIIQGNKFSARRGELYSLRREIISKLSEVDLFGTNWNKGFGFDFFHWSSSFINTNLKDFSFKSLRKIGKTHKNYCGEVENKHELLSKYKIAIVIENSPDFVSEKLFDAVRSGCVTIYVGPNLIKYGIPQGSSIETIANSASLVRTTREILEMDDSTLFEIAISQRTLLSSVSDEWENNKVMKDLAIDILHDLE